MINFDGRRVNCHGLLLDIIPDFRPQWTEKLKENPHFEYSIPEARKEKTILKVAKTFTDNPKGKHCTRIKQSFSNRS